MLKNLWLHTGRFTHKYSPSLFLGIFGGSFDAFCHKLVTLEKPEEPSIIYYVYLIILQAIDSRISQLIILNDSESDFVQINIVSNQRKQKISFSL